MADTVEVKYIYPPEWDGNASDDQRVGWKKFIVRLSGISDGSGETDVKKVDISELRMTDGSVPTRTSIEWIEWHCFGITCVLEWDRAPHEIIKRINANGVESSGKSCNTISDPSDGTDGTGDILLTTTNADSGDTYDITLCIKLKK